MIAINQLSGNGAGVSGIFHATRFSMPRLLKWGLSLMGLALVSVAAMFWSFIGAGASCDANSTPRPNTQIFEGVVYGCELLTPSEEGRGAIHWVRVDLNAPGIELFVTPLNPSAVEQGWQYRLQWVGSVLRREKLAVAINGALFTSVPTWRPRLPGDLAKGVETVVSDHVVSHVWEHTYLLWFDDQLNPSLETSKPPSQAALKGAKWAIGGQGVGLHNGKLSPFNGRVPNSELPLIANESSCSWRSVSTYPQLIFVTLARLGAKTGCSSTVAVQAPW